MGNTRILRAEAGTAVSYHMDLQNGTTLEPWLKAAVRQEYADSNQVKVNDDGKFNNDVAGTRGVYQAGIRSSFTPTLSGHLLSQLWQWRRGRIAVEYSGGCRLDVLITENKQAVMCHGLFIELIADIKKPTVRVGFFGIFGTRVV